jgi:hypothetical protein
MTETQVGELLERATADLRPTSDLVAGAVADGRRRRHRGLAMSAGGALAAAAVVGGALALTPGNGAAGDHTVVADPSGSTGVSSYGAQPSASTAPAADPTSGGPFPVAAGAMASTLAILLHGAETNTSNDQSHPASPDGWQSGALDLDGASVAVSYQHSTGPRCDGDMDRGDTSCTDLGNGYFLGTYSAEITTTAGPTGVRDVGVTYYTPDGYKINATASNASSTDPTAPTRTEPVLDLDALTAIAENPVWQGR